MFNKKWKSGFFILFVITAFSIFAFLVSDVVGSEVPRLETQIFSQSTFMAGSKASLRILVMDHKESKPVPGAKVKVHLRSISKNGDVIKYGREIPLFSARTDKNGTIDTSFRTPDVDDIKYEMTVRVAALKEIDYVTNQVRIKRERTILLTTDKPLYQPGQLIHIRALALKKPDLSAVSGESLTLEIEDAKSNKVYKKTYKTSEFGIASTDFQLADEINMGRYTIRAIIGGDVAEKKVTVERYVLPKFKIKFSGDKSFYTPNDTIEGNIQTDYFFGKPVSDAKVLIKASVFDFQFKEFAEINGTTDKNGNFKFSQQLPSYFVGQPIEQGNAFVKFDVAITDGADHQEKITQTFPVSAQSIQIIAIPESGRIIPNMENTIYVMTISPDGIPLERELLIKPNGLADIYAKTDASGIGEFKIKPVNSYLNLQIFAAKRLSASDEQPSVAEFNLYGQQQEDSVMLHIDKSLSKVGDKLTISVFSPTTKGTIYLDVVKSKQTLNTQAIELNNGKGSYDMPLTSDMDGIIEINAYRVSKSGQIVRDTRLVYVDPANDLSIDITADKNSYLPGKPAKIMFDVRNAKGRGIGAALGVSIVDESVFALQDMQPGMEKVYFLLEKELMEPKFEVHGITPSNIISPIDDHDLLLRRDKSAKVFFALAIQDRESSGSVSPFTLSSNSYIDKLEKIKEDLAKSIKEDYLKISGAINKFYKDYPNTSLAEKGGIHHLLQLGWLKNDDIIDKWGREYYFIPCGCGNYQHNLSVVSLGVDGIKETEDDTAVNGSTTNAKDAGLVKRKSRLQNIGGMEFEDVMFKADAIQNVIMEGIPSPPAAAMPGMGVGGAGALSATVVTGKADIPTKKEDVKVRQYFPETMYFNPAIITDNNGKAVIDLDVADSITTWRVSAMASSKGGALGSASQGMKVFQDFFIDIDLPVSLTQNDEVSIPVAVYNYLPIAQIVNLELAKEPWFDLMDSSDKQLQIAENDVRAIYYRIKVKDIGSHKLTIHAMGTKMSDAISRSIDVLPDGKEILTSVNDRLEKTVEKTIDIPNAAIDGASNILVKIYPGIFSQVVEGMDKILQMPFGCFEQTSSATYPNVLVLDYMKSAKQITPEIQMKAEQYINLGYQRLVTYEVDGGGFSWFGEAPANKILTAYGVMEFADMAKVYEVDQNLIDRTQKWLMSKRNADGSWSPDANYLHEESWGKIQKSDLLPTAWITWSLLYSGISAGELNASLAYLKKNSDDAKDNYTLAMVANALIAAQSAAGKSDLDSDTRKVIERLVDARSEVDGKVFWKSDVSTITFTRGQSADVETTALASIALINSGRYQDIVNRSLTYIIQSKDPNGTWGSTQATILSLKALLMSMQNRVQDINADIKVIVNGTEAGSFKITSEDSDVMRQIDCRKFVTEGKNSVKIEFAGSGSSLYQITGKYYMPWDKIDKSPENKLISINVEYDRTELAKDDILKSTVKIQYNKLGTADMVMVDLGIPPGFDVMTEDLERLVAKKVIQKYTVTGRQIILYFDKIVGTGLIVEDKKEKPIMNTIPNEHIDGKPIVFTYRLKAKFPIKARTPKSTAYLYYNPEINDVSAPIDILVK